MAERRMFSKTIIDSDQFLDMPTSTRLLYFDLSMRADDDGFVNSPKKIIRMTGASEDDLRILVAKQFIIPFESGIVVIKHWRIHNYIQKDRYKPTLYQNEYAQLSTDSNKEYFNTDTICTQDVSDVDTQDRLEIGEDRLEIGEDRLEIEVVAKRVDYQQVVDLYHDTCVSFPRIRSLSEARKKSISARLKKYSIDEIKEVFEKAERSDFLKGSNNRDWKATFDWMMKDTNMAKILDGNYDNKEKKPEHKKWCTAEDTGDPYAAWR